MSRTNAAAAKPATNPAAKGDDASANPFAQAASEAAKPAPQTASDTTPPKADTAKPGEGEGAAEQPPAPKVERTPLGKPLTYLPTVQDCVCQSPKVLGGVFRDLPTVSDMTDKEIAAEIKHFGDPNKEVSDARKAYEASQTKLMSEIERLKLEVSKSEQHLREQLAYLPGATKRLAELAEEAEKRKQAKETKA